MWDIIIDFIFRIFSKEVAEDATEDMVKDELKDITYKKLNKREWLKQKSHSLFSLSRYKKLDFRKWIRETDSTEIKERLLNIVKKMLRQNGVSERMIAKTSDIWEDETGVKKSLVTDRQFPYKYHYLTATLHSDKTIWRIRGIYYSANNQYVNIGITFMHNSTEYVYYRVPILIFYTMLIIPLTYVTKNKYLAGAYNYFWYSWWYKQPENTIMMKHKNNLTAYSKQFRFLNKSKKIKDKIKENRMKELKQIKWVKKGKKLILSKELK